MFYLFKCTNIQCTQKSLAQTNLDWVSFSIVFIKCFVTHNSKRKTIDLYWLSTSTNRWNLWDRSGRRWGVWNDRWAAALCVQHDSKTENWLVRQKVVTTNYIFKYPPQICVISAIVTAAAPSSYCLQSSERMRCSLNGVVKKNSKRNEKREEKNMKRKTQIICDKVHRLFHRWSEPKSLLKCLKSMN